MPTFQYTALNAAGRRVEGLLSGPSEQAVLGELETRRLTPIAIQPREQAASRRRRVSPRSLGTSYQALGDLLHAGVPLMRALRVLGNRKANPRLAAAYREVGEGVGQGEDLASAMARRPETFPAVHVAMIRAGEKGGFLEQVLQRLAQMVLAQAELRSTVVGNMIYPAVLVTVGTLILGVMFGAFIPRFKEQFTRLGDQLPAITKVVLAISDAVTRHGLITLVALAAIVVVAVRLARRPAVRERVVELRTRAPIVGPLTRGIATARLCRMLGTMLSSGVPMLQALHTAKDAAGNLLIERAVARAAEAVKAGQPLSGPLAESGLFEPDVVEMIAVGEAANNLDAVLGAIAETVEKRIHRQLTAAVRLVEPLLILLLAGVVVTVAIGLIMPMLQMSQGIK
ncbi:MAG: type II secretion system F family protein [Phycisphaerae bacterium]|nr:type II secretion system F family protein [Phycisphaerae bacterium]